MQTVQNHDSEDPALTVFWFPDFVSWVQGFAPIQSEGHK